MNEEEIRGKLVLPYLKDLGFDLSEISLEKSFTIRLGKTVREISGRSDILCKRNGENLFIIELKRDSKNISQNDIDQGISYATALTDGIAPFTIVTNGKITKLFDSVSRKELSGTKISDQSAFWQNGCTLSTEEDLRIRYEALKNFISFSDNNLKVFCEAQVQDRMGPIKGNLENMTSKFVEELHIQRYDLYSEFKGFISSECSIFGLIGSAGVGKTSSMCFLSLSGLENQFVLFYNAAIFNKSPLHYISNDLNLFFSGKSESDIVLKKLDDLGRAVNKRILIFIDAIDESADPNFAQELSELAHAVGKLDFIKIIVSCKLNIWGRFLKIRDNYTHLYEEVEKFHKAIPQTENLPGYLLTDFNDKEVNGIVPLYRNAFGFKGQISKPLKEELKNGFFLRIFSEVYGQKEIPHKVNDKELIRRYLQKSFERTAIGFQTGMRILSKIGTILLNHEYDRWGFYRDEGIEFDSLLERLGLSIDETIPEDFFDRNILIKSNNEDSYNITFYYSKIRDYIICYHSYRLDRLKDREFYEVLEDFYKNHIGQSAIYFYIENASTNHLAILSNFKRDKALDYVSGYEAYINQNFKNSKSKFNPKTDGNIGIIMPKDLVHEDGYALFPLDSREENKIHYEDLHNPFSDHPNNNKLIQKGVWTVHMGHVELMAKDQNKIIKKNVLEQLKKFIDKGILDAYNSEILLLEKVALILYFYHKKLGYSYNIEELILPRFDAIYPIDLVELQNRLYRFNAVEHYRWSGVDRSQIDQLVEEALKKPKKIPEYNTIGDTPPFKELFKIVNILLDKGHTQINSHYLPLPDKSVSETNAFYEKDRQQYFQRIRSLQFSEQQAKLYVEDFFKCLETCYKEFAEYCLPNIKNQLSFYKNTPHEYFFYRSKSDIRQWGMFGYRNSPNGKLKFNFKEAPTSPEDPFEKDGVRFMRGFSLEMILHNRDSIQTVDRINTRRADDYCVVRKWIYKILKSDMEDIFRSTEM